MFHGCENRRKVNFSPVPEAVLGIHEDIAQYSARTDPDPANLDDGADHIR